MWVMAGEISQIYYIYILYIVKVITNKGKFRRNQICTENKLHFTHLNPIVK